MWLNPQKIANLVTFTEEIFNRKLNFLCIGSWGLTIFASSEKYQLKCFLIFWCGGYAFFKCRVNNIHYWIHIFLHFNVRYYPLLHYYRWNHWHSLLNGICHINPFWSSVTFLYPLKTSENQGFSDVFRG